MIPGDAIVDAFIDANILLVLAYALWLMARFALDRTGLKNAHITQLKLLNGIFLAIAFSPFLVIALRMLQGSGYVAPLNVNLTDMVVSYYLNGGIDMKASEFERLLSLRDTFTLNLLHAAGWMAQVLIAAFLGGLAIGTVRLIYSMFCLRKIVAGSYAWRSFGRIRVRLSDRTLVPFSTRGLRNYYIVLPSHMLAQKTEMKISLAHEFQHLRQGDIEWEIVLEALKPFFFLNPAFHRWKAQVEDLRELSCDSQVLSRGRVSVRDYCDTLLSVCQKTLRRDRAFVIAVPKVTLVTADRSAHRDGKVSFLERRVTSMLDHKRLRYQKLVLAAVAAPLVCTILLAAVAIQRPGDWSYDRLMLSTVVNLERLDEINRLSTFGRIRN